MARALLLGHQGTSLISCNVAMDSHEACLFLFFIHRYKACGINTQSDCWEFLLSSFFLLLLTDMIEWLTLMDVWKHALIFLLINDQSNHAGNVFSVSRPYIYSCHVRDCPANIKANHDFIMFYQYLHQFVELISWQKFFQCPFFGCRNVQRSM